MSVEKKSVKSLQELGDLLGIKKQIKESTETRQKQENKEKYSIKPDTSYTKFEINVKEQSNV